MAGSVRGGGHERVEATFGREWAVARDKEGHAMLQVTSRAASTLTGARAQQGLPDHFGVRIFASATATPDMKSAYRFGFVEEPAAGDQVTEAEGTRVFVASEVADSLENAVLDTEDTGSLIVMPQNR